MKQKTLNLALGALALGMIALVAINRKEEAAKTEFVLKHGEPITALEPSSIERIAIRHPDAPEIRLEKKDNQWQLIAPVQAPADLVQVSNIIALATAERQGTVDIAKVKRPNLGLEPPRYTVTLNDTPFAVGEVEPLRFTRYVEIGVGTPEDRIVLIKDNGTTATDADYTGLLSKLLLPAKADIARIEVAGLRIERRGDTWTAQPASAEATPESLAAFVDGWRQIRAVSTERPTVEGVRRAKSPEFATVSLADGRAYKYEIGRRDNDIVFDRDELKVRYALLTADGERLLHLPKPKPPEATEPASGTPK